MSNRILHTTLCAAFLTTSLVCAAQAASIDPGDRYEESDLLEGEPLDRNPSADAADADSYMSDPADSNVIERPETQDLGHAQAPRRNARPAEIAGDEAGTSREIFRARPYANPRVAAGTCRPYEQAVTVQGEPRSISGTACLQPDGAWKIVQSASRTVSPDAIIGGQPLRPAYSYQRTPRSRGYSEWLDDAAPRDRRWRDY